MFDIGDLDWQNLIWVLLLLPVIWFNKYLWLDPMNRVRSLEEVGFKHLGHRKREWINRVRKSRSSGSTPPPFPNGWFVIMESRELKPGQVERVSALGLNLSVFRGSDSGQVFVTDAYCPHLGADLSAGGKVKQDQIECPFHLWRFDGRSGKCVDIPYAKKVPSFAELKTYTILERNGLIYLWHHSDQLEPDWQPPVLTQLSPNGGDWVYQGRNEYEISCHIQDIPENGADVAHLNAVHKSSILVGGEPGQWLEGLGSQIGWHQWGIKWQPETEEGRQHRAVVQLKHSMNLISDLQILSLDVRGEQIGPSFVHLHFESFMGKGVMIQYVLPLEPMLQKIVHVFYTQRSWIPPYAKLVLLGESILLERDIKVWNSKTYADKPVLVAEDSLVQRHRRWYSQFYSTSSTSRKDTSLNW